MVVHKHKSELENEEGVSTSELPSFSGQARLVRWWWDPEGATVYGRVFGRAGTPDGTLIRTSRVIAKLERFVNTVRVEFKITTASGAVYTLES